MAAAVSGAIESMGMKVAQDPDLDDIARLANLAQIGTYVILVVVGAVWFPLRIKATADKWFRKEALIPLSLAGEWQHGVCGVWCDPIGCLLSCFCPVCLRAETWYRMGWSQQCLGLQVPWQSYCGGLLFNMFLRVCCCTACCMSCIDALLRGGCDDQAQEVLSNARTFERTFGLEASYGANFVQWCCCSCCTNWQEWKQAQTVAHDEKTLCVGLPVVAPVAQQSNYAAAPAAVEMASAPPAAAPYR